MTGRAYEFSEVPATDRTVMKPLPRGPALSSVLAGPCFFGEAMNTISVEQRFGSWLKHNSRPPGTKVSTVVLHHDAGTSALSTINYLRKPLVLASYHYLIERDGVVWKCVPGQYRAWHAGLSRGPFGTNVNSYSVGVCLSNIGTGSEEYPNLQVAQALRLIDDLRSQFPHLKYITSHRLITKRKIDPAGFDFLTFARACRLEPWMDKSLGRGWNG